MYYDTVQHDYCVLGACSTCDNSFYSCITQLLTFAFLTLVTRVAVSSVTHLHLIFFTKVALNAGCYHTSVILTEGRLFVVMYAIILPKQRRYLFKKYT